MEEEQNEDVPELNTAVNPLIDEGLLPTLNIDDIFDTSCLDFGF